MKLFKPSCCLLTSKLTFYLRGVGFSPLPEKLATGGEDAYVSTSSVQAVLDGVSWWRDTLSVDAGLYSAALAKHMYEYVEDDLLGDLPASSLRLLQRGYELAKHGKILGTATALVATLQSPNKKIQDRDGYVLVDVDQVRREREERDGAFSEKEVAVPSSSPPVKQSGNHLLDVAFVGDCSLVVIRRGRIIYETEEQHHDVDFPFQLGDGSEDTPKDGVRLLIPVERGDVVVMGSDGIFDNVYTHKICDLMWGSLRDTPLYRMKEGQMGSSAKVGELVAATLAGLNKGIEKVVGEAINISKDIRADSPYATRCIENGANFEGGKPDDMTFLASIIEDEEAVSDMDRLAESEEVLFPPPYRDWP